MAPITTACLKLWLDLSARWETVRTRDRERGAVMAEYGMLLILVGIAAFAIVTLLGGEIWELFRETEEATDDRQVPPPAD